jgi:hypothetical protein
MTEKRIGKEWDSYRKHLIPKDASTVQIVESRRAFYAGAQSLLAIIVKMLDPGTDPTEADLRKMGEIDQELKDFCEDVKRGRA